MKKNRIYNFFIILLLYLAFSCFPFELIIKNNANICLWIQIGVQAIFLIVTFLIVRFKTDFNIKTKKRNIRILLLLLPTIIVVGSNFTYLLFFPSDLNANFNVDIIWKTLLTLFVVLNEEFIFRLLFISNFDFKSNWKKILISSSLFAVCHLSTFLSTFNPYDLIVVVYTFALGILLGIIFVKTNSIELCLITHFLFNFVNSIIFEAVVPGITNIWFYLLANAIGVVIAGLYLLVLMLTKKLIINDK